MQQDMSAVKLPPITDEFNPVAHSTLDGGQSLNKYGNDDKLFVKFSTRPVLHPRKSTNAGRAIYDEVDYIEIRTPGSQLTSIMAPVQEYLPRFAAAYEKWKVTRDEHISGTPLEAFPFLISKVALQAELKALNIHTVEQLAALPDVHKANIMGGIELSKRAAEWIDATQGTDAKVAGLASENEELKARLLSLENMMTETKAAPAKAAPAKAAPAKAAPAKV